MTGAQRSYLDTLARDAGETLPAVVRRGDSGLVRPDLCGGGTQPLRRAPRGERGLREPCAGEPAPGRASFAPCLVAARSIRYLLTWGAGCGT
ncbi:hypothetical protein GCM10009821_04330 [Aeromicrobium halocynthiae]|uniref:Uncharacterized protein n=2 Tax=Aeromicrobium halocynthiae TaxID=560557 RepID=A0ABP5HD58_9ACTN